MFCGVFRENGNYLRWKNLCLSVPGSWRAWYPSRSRLTVVRRYAGMPEGPVYPKAGGAAASMKAWLRETTFKAEVLAGGRLTYAST